MLTTRLCSAVKLQVCSCNGGRALGAFPARGTTESEQSESSVKRPIPQLLYFFFFIEPTALNMLRTLSVL